MRITCAHCGAETEKSVGHYNRAMKLGLNVYCGRACSGMGRRVERTEDEKKKIKADYDIAYRQKNLERKQEWARQYHKNNYDPQKASVLRKQNMHKHIERMRQPKWVAYKKEYDKTHRAKKMYGEFWESFLLVMEIQSLYDDKEIRQINNLHNKSQTRKRKWKTQRSL